MQFPTTLGTSGWSTQSSWALKSQKTHSARQHLRTQSHIVGGKSPKSQPLHSAISLAVVDWPTVEMIRTVSAIQRRPSQLLFHWQGSLYQNNRDKLPVKLEGTEMRKAQENRITKILTGR